MGDVHSNRGIVFLPIFVLNYISSDDSSISDQQQSGSRQQNKWQSAHQSSAGTVADQVRQETPLPLLGADCIAQVIIRNRKIREKVFSPTNENVRIEKTSVSVNMLFWSPEAVFTLVFRPVVMPLHTGRSRVFILSQSRLFINLAFLIFDVENLTVQVGHL